MNKIKNIFEKSFSHWKIYISQKTIDDKIAGFIQKDGWLIQYCFGEENGKNYMDYYAEHRMTDPSHKRIYENGEIKSLSHYKISYKVDQNPKITEQNRKEMQEYNKKIARELFNKGFNRACSKTPK